MSANAAPVDLTLTANYRRLLDQLVESPDLSDQLRAAGLSARELGAYAEARLLIAKSANNLNAIQRALFALARPQDAAAEKAASGIIIEEYRVLEQPTYGLEAGDPLLDPRREQTHRVLDLNEDEDGATVYQGTELQCEAFVTRKEAQGFHGIDFEVGPNPYHLSNLLAE